MEIEELLKGKNSRKIFGEAEIRIIKKQINNIALTQSEKNRLSRDIRPKVEFMREADIELKDLKKGSKIKKIIEKSKEIILKNSEEKVEAILLFGSHAKGEANWRSDIDLCVLFKNRKDTKEATRFRKKMAGLLNSKIDVQVFSTLPMKVKRDLMRKHRIVFQSREFDNIKFENKVLNKTTEFRQRIKEAET